MSLRNAVRCILQQAEPESRGGFLSIDKGFMSFRTGTRRGLRLAI
jgi:hypothetical protein